MRNRLVLTVTAGLALLTGCSDRPAGPPPAAAPATTGATTSAAAPSADAALASRDARLTVTAVHIEHLPGVDRITYELGGTGLPGWRVQYTDQAVQDGSGIPVEVAGQSVLEVRISGSAYPWDTDVVPYAGPDPLTNPAAPAIAGVYRTDVYEGTTQSFIGVNADHPAYTVKGGPHQLTVDITG